MTFTQILARSSRTLASLALATAVGLGGALAAGCAADGATDEQGTELARAGATPADPGTGGGSGTGGACTLDLSVCSPKDKLYTPAQKAACEAGVHAAYDRCVKATWCTEHVLVPKLAACGPKPSQPSPVFDRCMSDANLAYAQCVGAGSGPGTAP